MDEPGGARYPAGTAGRRQHVGTAKDGPAQGDRPKTAVAEPDDAVDDAGDVQFLLAVLPQWSGFILGYFQCNYHWYAIFHYRGLGWSRH